MIFSVQLSVSNLFSWGTGEARGFLLLFFKAMEMYAETEHLLPYFQSYSELAKDFCKTHKLDSPLSYMVQTSTVYEYNMGGEGDLFKAPEPIIEESFSGINPMMAAISMMSCGNTNISLEGLKDADYFFSSKDVDLLQNDQLLSEVYYEYEKELLEKGAMQTPLSEVFDFKNKMSKTDENEPVSDAMLQKSVSSGCLRSMDGMHGPAMKSSLVDFSGVDVGEAYRMRRAFSEGDIKTLSNGNGSQFYSPLEPPPLLVSNCTAEERKEKLSRYRSKKTKRNFGRKIKYACRKALADSQPRIRGRFARTEEAEMRR
ncbi:Zinc finger protein CO3, partial [Cucurbita argyrosperma subsp. sororia]